MPCSSDLRAPCPSASPRNSRARREWKGEAGSPPFPVPATSSAGVARGRAFSSAPRKKSASASARPPWQSETDGAAPCREKSAAAAASEACAARMLPPPDFAQPGALPAPMPWKAAVRRRSRVPDTANGAAISRGRAARKTKDRAPHPVEVYRNDRNVYTLDDPFHSAAERHHLADARHLPFGKDAHQFAVF